MERNPRKFLDFFARKLRLYKILARKGRRQALGSNHSEKKLWLVSTGGVQKRAYNARLWNISVLTHIFAYNKSFLLLVRTQFYVFIKILGSELNLFTDLMWFGAQSVNQFLLMHFDRMIDISSKKFLKLFRMFFFCTNISNFGTPSSKHEYCFSSVT